MKRNIIAVGAVAALALSGCAGGGKSGSTGAGSNSEGSDYPSEAITMLIAFDAGGSTDVGARLLATALEDELGVPITIENRPGAGGQIGYTAIANAEPDGQTMGVTTLPGVVVAPLAGDTGAEYAVEDFEQIALQVIDAGGMMVAPDSPINSVEDLVAAAKENPGGVRAATTGIVTGDHFGMLLLEEAAGSDLQAVHFSGSAPATTAFLGGNNVEVLIANVSDLTTLAENGSGKIIGLMSEEPSPLLPDVPTFAEAGYDEVVTGSARGYVFPAGTSEDKVERISTAIGNIMEDPEFQQEMKDLGLAPEYKNADEYSQFWDETVETTRELLPLLERD
ncbi:tripartite-type tricarboxylate transporter receptor subunit TctC [Arthrobacter sp. CAN_A214]|uniref:tripartite tricarboxylate transporter substrate binding protein n=1 Tax=Arthrobacter sp. CAN_A214 TaxID=2787720 RepID=UPI0018C91BC4